MSDWLLRAYESASDENRRTIAKLMLPKPGGVLVDIGCGGGEDALKLQKQIGAGHALGLELVDDWVELARSRGLDVRQADLSQPWPLEDESVDALHSNQVIEHMARTDHFMREVRRVLRPDGYAVLSTNNLSSWHNIVSLVLGWQPLPCHVSDESGARGNPATLGDEGSYGQETQGHLRVFTSRALVALAGQHHLALDRALASGYYPFGPKAARVLARFDRIHGAYLTHRYRPAPLPATATDTRSPATATGATAPPAA